MPAAQPQFVTEQYLDQRFDEFYTRMEQMVLRTVRTEIDQAIESKVPPIVDGIVKRVVGDEVGEIVSDALNVIDERFDNIEARLDRIEQRGQSDDDLHTFSFRSW